MIKVYCDNCDKEITGNVNVSTETIEVKDCHDNVITTFKGDILHYCDECQYNELTCGFKVGDQVITYDGRVGTITDICTCESCKKRGFYEPCVELEIGLYDIYITDSDKNNGFMSFYKIGNKVFGNIDEEETERIKRDIYDRKSEIISLEAQLNVLKKLQEEKEHEEENI